MDNKRRRFLKASAIAGAGATLAACAKPECSPQPGESSGAETTYRWKMATSWPNNFPALGTGARQLAERINVMSAGRIEIEVYGGGELVPPLEVFDAVSRGTVEMGHSASYYWKGKHEGVQFFSAIPFGLNAQDMNGWLYHGGGLELWQELYSQFDVVPFPVGNSGMQMGGWFNKEINTVDDLEGLKMRIPGLGGEVLRRVGGTPVNLPGAEIFTSLQTGAIDATEWIGPYNDLAFGLYQAAKYYYYPGWHEPGTTLECLISKAAYEQLPEDLKMIVSSACMAANMDMISEFSARNASALRQLVEDHGVELRRYPADVLAALKSTSDEVVAEIAASSGELSQRIFDSFRAYRDAAQLWLEISDEAFFEAMG